MPTETQLNDFSNEFASVTLPTQTDSANSSDTTTTDVTSNSTAKFRREIEIEGGGKQVFEADTADALIDKLTEAQTNATKKIREQATRLRAQPIRSSDTSTESVAFKPKELSLDDKFALSQKLQNDPDGGFEDILQAKTGMTSADLRELKDFVSTIKGQQAQATIDTKFLQDHAEEFYPSPANATAINNFLKSENLPYNNANLDYAFQELTESGLLEVKPDATTVIQTGDETQRIAVKPHTRTKPLSTGLRNDISSSRTSAELSTPEVEAEADVKKIFAEPDLDKARTLMLAAMAKAKKSSSR